MTKKIFAMALAFILAFNFLSAVQAATDEEKAAKKEKKIQKKQAKQLAKAYRKKNIEQVEKWAQNGDLQAQIILYYVYSEGEHVQQNLSTADEWKRKVGKDHKTFLENFIPIAYHNKRKMPLEKFYGFAACHAQLGDYIPVNFEDAVRWAQMGASENDPLSLAVLGSAYYTGRGIAQDYKKAIEYFKLAHEEPIALYLLSDAYARGNGVDRDLDKSKFYADYYRLVIQPKIDEQTQKNMRRLKRQMEEQKETEK